MGEDGRMSETSKRTAWWRRRWTTVGEVVGVAALTIAGLGYWDAHRERSVAQAEKAVSARREAVREALVLTGSVEGDGARLTLAPMRAGQAVQSQRYLFPRAVLDHAMEVTAAQPQIDRAWFEDGLKREVDAAARASGVKVEGEGELPVAVTTTYLEDGDLRTDRSLYRVGYRITPGGLFHGAKVTLQGLGLLERAADGDLQAKVDARWRAAAKLR